MAKRLASLTKRVCLRPKGHKSLVMPRLLLALLAAGVPLVGSAVDGAATVRIGAETFCVPQENLIEVPGWLEDATRHLPKEEAFAFVIPLRAVASTIGYVPQLNIKGEPMPPTGTLAPRQDGEWLSRLSPDSYWRRIAESPNAIIEIDRRLRHIRAYETEKRDRWIVWAIKPGFEVSPRSIANGGSFAALCHRTDFRAISSRRIDETTSCERQTLQGEYFLSYSFAESNIARLQEMDQEFLRVVLSWRCKKPTA